MNETAPHPKAVRRWGFACVQCRRSKLKCGGEQPACKRCRRINETCEYPQRATESRLEQARQRIAQLEEEIAQIRLQQAGETPNSIAGTETVACLAQGSTSVGHRSAENADGDLNEVESEREADGDGTDDDISPHVGLDEYGEVTYHGPTSRFHAASLDHRHMEMSRSHEALRQHRQWIRNYAFESNSELLHRVWQPLLKSKTEQELGAPPALAHKLLDLYWTWQHPLHSYVYRPCFIMDMALGGPYYSKFLLHAIFALAARHLDTDSVENQQVDKGEKFLASAREFLVHELAASKPRIPTIQGLLILGGRQCAVGETSQGWAFTGMGIRMMVDLGLHLNLNSLSELEKLTPPDLELRKRLYCSAYIWDKSLSLSLGRPPSLTSLSPIALEMFDRSDDEAIWQPQEFPRYPPTQMHTTTCFINFCKLGRVIETILLPASHTTLSPLKVEERLSKTEKSLFQWYEQLPTVLKIGDKPALCPPTHILCLNLLYHTLHIILWRPFMHFPNLTVDAANRCIGQAKIVHDMFVLYGQSFQWAKMTYLVSYCVYTAATVDIELMKSPDSRIRGDATERLAVSLRILETEAKQTPGIRRSIDIIKRQLRTWVPNSRQILGAHEQSHMARPLDVETSPLVREDDASLGLETIENNQPPGNVAEYPHFGSFPDTVYASNGPNVPVGFEFGDTGAGFHPEAFPWANLDDLDADVLGSTYYQNGMY